MKTSSGPESVRHLLNRFAIATILAVGLLGLARPTEAEIVYTPVNITIGPNSSYNLDVNNDGVTDFTISTHYFCCIDGKILEKIDETPASGNGAEGSPPARLIEGDQIGPSQSFYGGTGIMACIQICTGNWNSEFKGYGGFLGLSFQIDGETYYGWAKISVNMKTDSATLHGYAYETIPGMPINAGQH